MNVASRLGVMAAVLAVSAPAHYRRQSRPANQTPREKLYRKWAKRRRKIALASKRRNRA